MAKHFVSDTTALIEYYFEVFREFAVGGRATDTLSAKAKSVFASSIYDHNYSPFRLTLSSVTFIEIFEKWLINEPDSRRFYYDVYVPIVNSPNVEIRAIDAEVLETFSSIGTAVVGEHDKIVLATAITLNATLVTNDGDITEWFKACGSIPGMLW